ncbi:MAG TPA: ATP-binding protein [Candidatus Brocadiales bacterium]|nr:ATP-binding protein [Candidatus Brocadiales bacterium]
MSIFLKKIDDITIDDIEKFILEKHSENVRLEYKSGFSTTDTNFQIAKEVSAFANQQGGVILYGVTEEPGKTRRPDAIVGIDKNLNPREKIQSVCIDHIYPPIVPDVVERELQNDSNKVVVIVRIEMSDMVPHTINNRTGFYIRSQDRCDPREMTEEEIELLWNRRAKLVERRDWLLRRTYERVFPKDVKRDYMLTPSIMMAIPLYPMHPLIERGRLLEVYYNSKVHEKQGFPLVADRIMAASDSIYGYTSPESADKLTVKKENYGELNILGQVSYFGNPMRKFDTSGEHECILLDRELRNLFLMVKFLCNFYKNLGYWGIIKFILKVENCRGVKFSYPDPFLGAKMELDTEVNVERDCAISQLLENPEGIIEDIFQEYLWSIGLSVPRATAIPVGDWLNKTKMDFYGTKRCPKCSKKEISKIDEMCMDCKSKS